MQILQDEKGTLNISEVTQPSISNKFHRYDTSKNIKGVYWIRFRLKNLMNDSAQLSLEATGSHDHFFLFTNNHEVAHFVQGDLVPWDKRGGFKAMKFIPFHLSPGRN